MAIFYSPFVQILDTSGVPIIGAKLESYKAGTTEPSSTFSDADRTTPNANPASGATIGNQVTGSDGRFGAIYLADSAYKFVLKDAEGAQIDEADHVNPLGSGRPSLDNIAQLTAILKSNLVDEENRYVGSFATSLDGGQGNFEWDSTSSATAITGFIIASDEGGDGRWFRIIDQGIVLPEMAGAKGDAITDDETAFFIARDYARDNSLILQGNGGSTYLLNSLTGYLEQTVGTYKWRDLKLACNPLLNTRFIWFAGPGFTDELLLTTNVDIGDTTVTVTADGTGYATGDLALVYSEANFHGSQQAGVNGKKTFFSRVTLGQSQLITLNESIPRSLLMSDNARIFICPETMIVDWDGVEISNSAATPVAGSTGVRFDQAVPALQNCSVMNFDNSSYTFVLCYNLTVLNCLGEDSFATGTGYAFNVGGCYNPSLSHIVGNNVRHIVTIGDGGTGTPGNRYDNVCGQGGHARGIRGERIRAAAIDSHTGHICFDFADIDAEVIATSGEGGAVLQGYNINVDGLRIRGAAGTAPIALVQWFGGPIDEAPGTFNFFNVDGTQSRCRYGFFIDPRDEVNQTNLTVNCYGFSGVYQFSAVLMDASAGEAASGGNATFNCYGGDVTAVERDGLKIDTRTFRSRLNITYQGVINTLSPAGNYSATAISLSGALSFTVAQTLTLSATSGAAVLVTAGAGTFQPEHVGDFIDEQTSGSGVGEIIEVQSATVAVIDTTVGGGAAFSSTSISSSNWRVDAVDPAASILWTAGKSIRSATAASEAHFRTTSGRIVLGSEVKIYGSSVFKDAASGIGEVYRDAAPSVATS